MKKHLKRLLASLLSLTLILGATAVTAFAVESAESEEAITIDMEKSGFDEEAGVFNLYLTINETASGDLTVDLASATKAVLNQYAAQYGYNTYPIMPSDTNSFNVIVTNKSGHEYAYKSGSFKLATAVDLTDSLSPFVAFDGQKIPYSFIGAIPASHKAIYQNLFGVKRSSQVTANMMFSIYDYLTEKGYTGESALTDYLLDYYSNLYGVNYANWDELATAKPNLGDTFARAGSEGIYFMSYKKMKEYCAAHPELEPFVYYTSKVANPSGDDEVRVQIKWPEKDLAVFSYDIFYQEYLSFAYGEEEMSQMNPIKNIAFTRTRGVGDYMDTSGELYKKTDAFYAGLENADSLTQDEALEFSFMWALDGPGVGNGYQRYEFAYQNTFGLKQLDGEEEIPDEDPPLAPPEEEKEIEEDISDEDIPLAPPKTGDYSAVALAIGMLIVAAAGAVLVRRKVK